MKRTQCHFKVLLRYGCYNGKFVAWVEPKKSTHFDNPTILGLCLDAVEFFKFWDARQRITARNVGLKDHYDAWKPRHGGTQTSIYRLNLEGPRQNGSHGRVYWKSDGMNLEGKRGEDKNKSGKKKKGAVDADEPDTWSLFARLEEACRSRSSSPEPRAAAGEGSNDVEMSGVEDGSALTPATAGRTSKVATVEDDTTENNPNPDKMDINTPSPIHSNLTPAISEKDRPSVDADETSDIEIPPPPPQTSSKVDLKTYKSSTMIYDTITKKSMPLSKYEALFKKKTLEEGIIAAKIERIKNKGTNKNPNENERSKRTEGFYPPAGPRGDNWTRSELPRDRDEGWQENGSRKRGRDKYGDDSYRRLNQREGLREQERDFAPRRYARLEPYSFFRGFDREEPIRKRAKFDDREFQYEDHRGLEVDHFPRPEERNDRKRTYDQYNEDRDYDHDRRDYRNLPPPSPRPEEPASRKRTCDQYISDYNHDYDHGHHSNPRGTFRNDRNPTSPFSRREPRALPLSRDIHDEEKYDPYYDAANRRPRDRAYFGRGEDVYDEERYDPYYDAGKRGTPHVSKNREVREKKKVGKFVVDGEREKFVESGK
jgi:hypothetical protein